MQTVDVAAKDWPRALDEFSAMHEGALVSLQLLAPDLGAQTEVRDMPLLGITAEAGPGGATITIAAARSHGDLITHIVHSPTHVRVERTNDGMDVALQVESAEGTVAILWLNVGSDTGGR
jgi:hypothetical protein